VGAEAIQPVENGSAPYQLRTAESAALDPMAR